MSHAATIDSKAAVGGSTGAPAQRAGVIAIVDDEATNIKVLRKFLQREGYQAFATTTVAADAWDLLQRNRVDVLLLDVMMPEVSGLEILQRIREHETTSHIPVIILTASADEQTRRRALELGATDFLSKPVDMHELFPRVRNALLMKAQHDRLAEYADRLRCEVAEQTRELTCTRQEVVHCLARAAEYRDNETGRHVIRVGRYAGLIARELAQPAEWVELLELAAPLHDVGKIGIPDEILRKPGKLTAEEIDLMRTHAGLGKRICDCLPDYQAKMLRGHADIGARILAGQSQLLQMAARIAISHHEHWDGSGYPLALAGENIPLEGRITSVADVFDALASKRPYKAAYPMEKCLAILEEGRARQFDPRVLDALLKRLPEVIAIQIEFADYA